MALGCYNKLTSQDCSEDVVPPPLRPVDPLNASGEHLVVRSMATVLTRKYVQSADTQMDQSTLQRKGVFRRERLEGEW